MRKFTSICLLMFIVLLVTSACSSKKENRSTDYSAKKNDKLYAALNYVIDQRSLERDSLLLIIESKEVYRTMWGDDYSKIVTDPNEPPPPLILYITEDWFNEPLGKKLLRIDEANSIHSSLDSSRIVTIDPSRVGLEGVHRDSLNRFLLSARILLARKRSDSGSELVEKFKAKYGCDAIVEFSTPVFSADSTKMLLAIEKSNFGSLSITYYLLAYDRGRWTTLYEREYY